MSILGLNTLKRAWCSGFGLGFVPKAPGTAGTCFAFLLLYGSSGWSWPMMITIWALLMALSVRWCATLAKAGEDPQWIVCDEFLAMWLVLWFLPHDVYHCIIAFACFRFFDILKPFPIAWIERALPAAWAIMLDDTMAAFYAWVAAKVLSLAIQYMLVYMVMALHPVY